MQKYNYPKGEIVWVTYLNCDGRPRFIITSRPARDFYYLYEADNGTFQKLGKSKSPLELEQKFQVKEVVNKQEK